MPDMSKPDRLFKRGATWYYRRLVPTELVPVFSRPEIKFSLKTVKKSEALLGRANADIDWDAKFEEAREALISSSNINEQIEYDEAVKHRS